MFWQWNSQKGRERQSNSDAVAVINGRTFFFAMLVDAAEKSNKSNQFARYLTERVASSVLELKTTPSSADLLNIMRNTQKQLRYHFLQETASYIVLVYDKNAEKGLVLSCGDCRLALLSSDIKWLTKTDTLLTAFDESQGHVKKELMTRHTLTSSLNAKRFASPKVITIGALNGKQWILCSDGYWAEHIDEKISWEKLKDDASCLTIATEGLLSEQSISDCENCFSYNLNNYR